MTTRLAYSLLDTNGRLKTGRFVDAAIRGSLLIDLAAARLVLEHDGALRPNATKAGFAPADQLLAEAASMRWPTVRGVVCQGAASRDHVARELVARRAWAVKERSLRHPTVRYEVSNRLPEPSRENPSDVIVDLMLWLLESDLDEDDFDSAVTEVAEATANRLIKPVLAELLDLRGWLAVPLIGTGGDSAS